MAAMIGPLCDLEPGIRFDARLYQRRTSLVLTTPRGEWHASWPAALEPQALQIEVGVLVQAANAHTRGGTR
jgi:hypothetical protein